IGDVGGQYQVEPGNDVVSGGGAFHGKSGTKVSYDGMGMENSSGNSSFQLTASSVEEIVMSTSGISADTNADGVVVNIIPNDGGGVWNKTQDVFLRPPGAAAKGMKWTPYVDRPLDRLSGRQEWYDSVLGRITWQASKANKFAVTYNEQRGCNCGSVSTAESQEHYLSSYRFYPNRLVQGTWNSTLTSRLLLEAGFAATISQWNMYYNPG